MKHTFGLMVVRVILLMCLLPITAAGAASERVVDIPPALRAWEAWVLHDKADQRCPSDFNDPKIHRCWWPSRLSLDVGAQGGLFDQQVTVYAPAWVNLPGDESHWPESVSDADGNLPVVGRNGRPSIRLDPGDYHIKGAFVWDRLPEILQVPASVAIVSLVVDGQEIAEPDLDADGRLRLHGKSGARRPEDAMRVDLFRLIEDDIPMRVITRIALQVSGRPREIRLAELLPAGAAVMNVDSPLPIRVANRKDLLIQARPGRWDIRVTVRMKGPVTRLPAGKAPYGDEIWSFKAFNDLRMVTVRGAPTVEPSRTRMPDAWKAFPAYLLKSGAALSFDVLRRGDPNPAPDQLSLDRSWWLDFNGGGFTVHDRINGTLSRTWHLAMSAPMVLGRVVEDGRDRLITLQGKPPSPGVQLRRGRLSLEADSRLARASSTLPAVGWDHDVQHLGGTLHLPPGWRLFSAAGVDIPAGAWLQQWSLLDFFLVLIIAISAYKIRSRTTAILALLTLTLTFHEPGSPRYVWLHLLAAAALLKYLPQGRFRKLVMLWGAGAVIALVVIALPFMVRQVRVAIYPQLARGGPQAVYPTAPLRSNGLLEQQKAAAPLALSRLSRKTDAVLQSYERQSEPMRTRFLTPTQDLIQTGPGLPAWQWRTVQLRWNGPVNRTQKMHLWLISPALNLVIGLLRVLLLAALIIAFLDLRNWRRHLPAPLTTGIPVLMLMLAILLPAQSLRAATAANAFPPQRLLDELQRRLLEPPPCMPACADLSRLELSITPDELQLIMQAHAQVDTAIPLPETAQTWRPNRMMLDNDPVKHLARDDHGNLWMVLPRGVHKVKMIGPTGDSDEIRLAFPIVPHIGTYAGVGWRAQGFRPDGAMNATIVLTRAKSDTSAPVETPKAEIPAFFHVTRVLHLGIQWEVTTRIRRITPAGEPVVLAVPLLKGAVLTTAGIQVADGVAQVALGPSQTEATFSATIPITDSIRLTAPRNAPWTETWMLDAAAMWRCALSGLTVVHHQDAAHNWQPQWQPWPGEQVTIDVSRPQAVPGRTITIDSAELTFTPGQQISQAALTLALRSSKGGQHQIELPAQVNLQSVAVNGKSLPIRQEGKLVSVPLAPGAQTIDVKWLQLSDSAALIKGPPVNVGDAAVNAAVTFRMPDDRWILLAGGPRLGPAVLFWSYLIVVLLAGIGLGRTDITPLNTGGWILLGLGLTQAPAVVAVLVAGWLLALGYRGRRDAPQGTLVFNLTQILLTILTIAALAGLYTAIEHGLLGIPDMQIAGNHSTRFQLNWFQDRIDGSMPAPWVISLPQWTFHLIMLAWSLWLAFSLVSWLQWGWGCFSRPHLWQSIQWRRKAKRAEDEKAHQESKSDSPPPFDRST
jgi:hypothetical protein